MDVTGGVSVRISAGELLDRLAILRIKRDRITDPARSSAVAAEVRELEPAEAAILATASDVTALAVELREVNATLWDLEDEIRRHERQADFGPGFIAAARGIARTNDRRSGLKHRINERVGSRLVEAKCYAP